MVDYEVYRKNNAYDIAMSQKQTRRYCPFCKKNVMAVGSKPNHLLHFFLSVFTGGFWLIIWVLVSVAMIGGYRCVNCGAKL